MASRRGGTLIERPRDLEREEGPVSHQDLVAAVATEGDLDVFASDRAQEERREDRLVAHRFVQHFRDTRDQVAHAIGGEHFEVVFRAQCIRRQGRIARLIETLLLEADGEGLNVLGVATHVIADRGRIEPSTEKKADRHVGDQAAARGLVEQSVQLSYRPLARSARLHAGFPIASDIV